MRSCIGVAFAMVLILLGPSVAANHGPFHEAQRHTMAALDQAERSYHSAYRSVLQQGGNVGDQAREAPPPNAGELWGEATNQGAGLCEQLAWILCLPIPCPHPWTDAKPDGLPVGIVEREAPGQIGQAVAWDLSLVDVDGLVPIPLGIKFSSVGYYIDTEQYCFIHG